MEDFAIPRNFLWEISSIFSYSEPQPLLQIQPLNQNIDSSTTNMNQKPRLKSTKHKDILISYYEETREDKLRRYLIKKFKRKERPSKYEGRVRTANSRQRQKGKFI